MGAATTRDRRLASLLAEGSLLRPQRRVTLREANADAYVGLLLELLGRGRLNRTFPPRRRLENLYRALAPAANHHLYRSLEIGTRTGLPGEKMITRVQADQALADRVCHDEEERDPGVLRDRAAASRPDEDLHLRRYRYHRALRERPVQPSFAAGFELRRFDQARGTTHLVATVDRFDLGEELFARTTVHLAHTAGGWSRPLVRLDGDRLEVGESFENLIARATVHDSELAFLLLSETPSLTVESVARARVGPLYAAGMDGPPELQPLLERHPGELVLALPTDRTAIDVGRDSSADPFAVGYREFLPPEARELVEERRRRLGYRVRRQRKLVSTPGVAPALRGFLQQKGTPCLIYTLG